MIFWIWGFNTVNLGNYRKTYIFLNFLRSIFTLEDLKFTLFSHMWTVFHEKNPKVCKILWRKWSIRGCQSHLRKSHSCGIFKGKYKVNIVTFFVEFLWQGRIETYIKLAIANINYGAKYDHKIERVPRIAKVVLKIERRHC